MAIAFALLIGLGIVLFGLVPLWWIARGRSVDRSGAPAYSVTTVGSSRGGDVVYREGEREVRFGWKDLAGRGPYVCSIYVPDEMRWPEVVPWAIGRREDILERVAREMKRQRCPGCRVEFGPDRIDVLER